MSHLICVCGFDVDLSTYPSDYEYCLIKEELVLKVAEDIEQIDDDDDFYEVIDQDNTDVIKCPQCGRLWVWDEHGYSSYIKETNMKQKLDQDKVKWQLHKKNYFNHEKGENESYMHNQNLLQSLTTPKEYLDLLQHYRKERLRAREQEEYWKILPEYIGAKCPICGEEYKERLDTYSLREWIFFTNSHIFSEESSKKFCEHYFFTENFLYLNENEPQVNNRELIFSSILPPEVPYIQTPILNDNSSCRVVFHSLPICRIEEDEFVPRYSLFMLSYFIEPSEREQLTATLTYFGNNPDRRTFTPGPFNEEDEEKEKLWFDLKYWVKKGKLYWLEPDNPDLPLKNSPIKEFPYADIQGNLFSQKYPKEENPFW